MLRVLQWSLHHWIAAVPCGKFHAGAIVATAMGGLGRALDGGYAKYTCVPVDNVQAIPADVADGLGWETLGAVPEMLQIAWGLLFNAQA